MTYSHCKLLVVDDNEVNRDMLKLRLEVKGMQVELASDGHEALEMLSPQALYVEQAYDLVLLDVMMPEISGLDVLKEVRKNYTMADLPVIMVTARDASEDVVEALQLGANDYVTKPIDFPVLFARLDAALKLKRLTRQKDEFLSIASHDLKNPLSVTRGLTRLVRMLVPVGQAMTAEADDMLERVNRQTVTMERIITDFLDFQAMEDGRLVLQKEKLDLVHVCRTVLYDQKSYAEQKQVKLQADLPEGSLVVEGDEARLEQVLNNFVNNAIKFMPSGGEVLLRLVKHNGSVTVEVRDDGPGIPPHELEQLFVKYSRLSNRPTGGEKSSGLGLAIAKMIIELHEGTIGARNNPEGAGATFYFTLNRE